MKKEEKPYDNWKINSSLLYDYVIGEKLEWPATCAKFVSLSKTKTEIYFREK